MSSDTQELDRVIRAAINEALAPLLERDARPLLSVPGAAERLNISPKSVWNMIADGKIPTVLIGEGRRMIEPAALDAYIASRRGLTGLDDGQADGG